MKSLFTTHLNLFLAKLKLKNFEDVTLTKVIHFYVVKSMNAQYT
jgi:hypothetical protein